MNGPLFSPPAVGPAVLAQWTVEAFGPFLVPAVVFAAGLVGYGALYALARLR